MVMKIEKIQKEIRIVGLQRSGNHAITNWILKQLPGVGLFFNNVLPESPFEESVLEWSNDTDTTNFDFVIYSFEDRSLHAVSSPRVYPSYIPDNTPAVEQRIDIIILRDPFNLMASRFNHGRTNALKSSYPTGLTVPELWVMYAREFIGETNFLREHKIPINYNLWCVSKEYRKKLAVLLGLEFSDTGFNDVTNFGGGSSFDGTGMNSQASQMSTAERWLLFRDDKSYATLFRDKAILDLSNEIFDLSTELRNFIERDLAKHVQYTAIIKRAYACSIASPFIAYLRDNPRLRKLWRRFGSPIRLRQLAAEKKNAN
jgi:hypothetical protein